MKTAKKRGNPSLHQSKRKTGACRAGQTFTASSLEPGQLWRWTWSGTGFFSTVMLLDVSQPRPRGLGSAEIRCNAYKIEQTQKYADSTIVFFKFDSYGMHMVTDAGTWERLA